MIIIEVDELWSQKLTYYGKDFSSKDNGNFLRKKWKIPCFLTLTSQIDLVWAMSIFLIQQKIIAFDTFCWCKLSSLTPIHFLTIPGSIAVLQRRLKMDRRRIRRFFGFWKWTEDEYEESSLIQNFFEDLRRLQILRISSKIRRFSKENEKFLLLKFSFSQQLEQIFSVVELNIMWGKLKFKNLRKVHISWLFQTILYTIMLNFPKKSS